MQLPALPTLCEDHMVNRPAHAVRTPHGTGPAAEHTRGTSATCAHLFRGDA